MESPEVDRNGGSDNKNMPVNYTSAERRRSSFARRQESMLEKVSRKQKIYIFVRQKLEGEMWWEIF